MYNCPRKASVVAVTDCALWTLDRLFFRHVSLLRTRISSLTQ